MIGMKHRHGLNTTRYPPGSENIAPIRPPSARPNRPTPPYSPHAAGQQHFGQQPAAGISLETIRGFRQVTV